MSKRTQTIIIIAGTIVIAFLLIWKETYMRQRKEFFRAEDYYQKFTNETVGEKKDEYAIRSITHYDSAIHMYTPWSSKIAASAERLAAIGNYYADIQDYDIALNAYRSLRSSFYATRSTYQPYPGTIKTAESRIAELVKLQQQQEDALRIQQDQEKAEAAARMKEELAKEAAPPLEGETPQEP